MLDLGSLYKVGFGLISDRSASIFTKFYHEMHAVQTCNFMPRTVLMKANVKETSNIKR